MEIGFPLVGGEKGLKGSIIRARVFERKPEQQNYHRHWRGSWIIGKNLERAILESNHPQRLEEIFRIRGKSFSGVGKHH